MNRCSACKALFVGLLCVTCAALTPAETGTDIPTATPSYITSVRFTQDSALHRLMRSYDRPAYELFDHGLESTGSSLHILSSPAVFRSRTS